MRHAGQEPRGERRSSVLRADGGNLYRGKSVRRTFPPSTACRSFSGLKGETGYVSTWTYSIEKRSLRRMNSRSSYGVVAHTPESFSLRARSPHSSSANSGGSGSATPSDLWKRGYPVSAKDSGPGAPRAKQGRSPTVIRRGTPDESKQLEALKLLVGLDRNCRQGPVDLGKIGAGPHQRPPKGRVS